MGYVQPFFLCAPQKQKTSNLLLFRYFALNVSFAVNVNNLLPGDNGS